MRDYYNDDDNDDTIQIDDSKCNLKIDRSIIINRNNYNEPVN